MRHTSWLLIVLAGTGGAQWRRFGEGRQAVASSSLARGTLAAHNAVRARVEMAPLAWSDRLAARSQDWADTLLARKQFGHRPNSTYGENLFEIGGATASAAQVVNGWAAESRDYDYNSNRCRGVCGHYTQIVWGATKEVGCAVARGRGREVWVPDSKTPNGAAKVPLSEIAVKAFESQIAIAGPSPYLFPSEENPNGYQMTFKTVWRATLRRAGVRYFRIYNLRSTYATRLSAGGVADEWVTQMLRQGNAKVFKKYSQMKLQMKREALEKLNRYANEGGKGSGTVKPN